MIYQDSFIVARHMGSLVRLRSVKGEKVVKLAHKTKIVKLAHKEVIAS